jgi:hypothetical protein
MVKDSILSFNMCTKAEIFNFTNFVLGVMVSQEKVNKGINIKRKSKIAFFM